MTAFYFEPENHWFDGAEVYKITDSAAGVDVMTDGKTWVKINQPKP